MIYNLLQKAAVKVFLTILAAIIQKSQKSFLSIHKLLPVSRIYGYQCFLFIPLWHQDYLAADQENKCVKPMHCLCGLLTHNLFQCREVLDKIYQYFNGIINLRTILFDEFIMVDNSIDSQWPCPKPLISISIWHWPWLEHHRSPLAAINMTFLI